MEYCCIDWMHTVDLGVSQFTLGGLFFEILDLLPGASRKTRLQGLWDKIQGYYTEHPEVHSKLDKLTEKMIRKENRSPELSIQAAETRGLIRFGALLAVEYSGPMGSHRHQVCCLLQSLQQMYHLLEEEVYPAEEMATECQRFMLLYSGLRQEAVALGQELAWTVRPKHHLMMELLCKGAKDWGHPKQYWCYRDEDWGRWLALAALKRGGAWNPSLVARNCMRKMLWHTAVAVWA